MSRAGVVGDGLWVVGGGLWVMGCGWWVVGGGVEAGLRFLGTRTIVAMDDSSLIASESKDRAQAIVDKFMGDGIMAVFGAPIPRSDDADRAVDCGKAMMRAIEEHNRSRVDRGLPQLRHGVGVHYGPVIAGNVGTAARAAYTVIGDTVNLASRLEKTTKQVGVDLVVSEQTVRACSRDHDLDGMGEIQVPGRAGSVTIYGLL